MYDDLAIVIKQAGESFEPPWLDVRAVAKRGRRRWWLTRAVAATTSLALIAGATAVAANVDMGRQTAPAARGSAWEWERIPDAPIRERVAPVTAWTGEELIVSGGYLLGKQHGLRDGAAYDPAAGTWEELPRAPHPIALGTTSVWTGDELIVWGGDREDDGYEGMAFDPGARRWRELPQSPYWSSGGHSAVWSGEEMIVWGGVNSTQIGAAYHPGRDRWRAIPRGPLGSRHDHEAVWAGDAMVVWGGSPLIGTPVTIESDTAAFDPVSGNWAGQDASPLPPLSSPVSVWTGNELVVAGGQDDNEVSRAAAAWAPVDGWREIAPVPVAAARDDAAIPVSDLHTTPVWTGSEAVFVTADGVLAYDPRTDDWSTIAAPPDAARIGATTAWTGDALIVWSGNTWAGEDLSAGGWIARS